MKKRRKPRLPASPSPHPCVILGIDPGATSGWAILTPESSALCAGNATAPRLRCGTVNAGRNAVIVWAQEVAAEQNLPLIVVAEKWTAGGWASHTTLLGLGAVWGKWEAALSEAGHPKRRIVRVYPQTWRARVIGGRQRSTEDWKAAAQTLVKHRFDKHVSSDAAEAACIALWGLYAGEVGAVLPKRKAAPR